MNEKELTSQIATTIIETMVECCDSEVNVATALGIPSQTFTKWLSKAEKSYFQNNQDIYAQFHSDLLTARSQNYKQVTTLWFQRAKGGRTRTETVDTLVPKFGEAITSEEELNQQELVLSKRVVKTTEDPPDIKALEFISNRLGLVDKTGEARLFDMVINFPDEPGVTIDKIDWSGLKDLKKAKTMYSGDDEEIGDDGGC